VARRADRKPSANELRTIAAAFLHVTVGELLPHLVDVASNSTVAPARYLARCPVCHQQALSFSQGRNGIVCACAGGCSAARVAAFIVARRLAAGEHPENLWGRADRALRGEDWTP
jgi:hypothetical protein